MRQSRLPETFDRRLPGQYRPVRYQVMKAEAITATLMLHGAAAAMLLLAHPSPKSESVPAEPVEVILSTPAPLDEAVFPGAEQAPAVPTAAADLAEKQYAKRPPYTAALQAPELSGEAPSTPAALFTEAPAMDAGSTPVQEPAEAMTADPPPAFVAAQALQPPVGPAPVVAEAAHDPVPATAQAPVQPELQIQTQPAQQVRHAPQHVTVQRPIRPARPQVRPLMEVAAQASHPVPARPGPASAPALAAQAAGASTAPPSARQAHNGDHEAALEARIRDAVQAAVHYPAAARMMSLTGRARLQLDYRNGAASPALVQSSGAPMLDDAALSAARAAHYPSPPPDIGDRLLRLLVWVEFQPS
jgi:protein TonB